MWGLFQPQEPFHEVKIRLVHFTANAIGTFTFGTFLGKKVASIGLPVHDLSGSGNFKSLFCPGMGLYLWHYLSFTYYPTGGFAQAKLFWDHLG